MINGRFIPAVSTGGRNTLVFLERWGVEDEVSDADVLHRQPEVGDVGSLAAPGVDEFDWTVFELCVVVDLAFLAPDIVREITNGAQPMGLTSDWCWRHDLPSDWQRDVSASQPPAISASRIADIACPDGWAICGHKPEEFASTQLDPCHNLRKPRSYYAARLVSQVLWNCLAVCPVLSYPVSPHFPC